MNETQVMSYRETGLSALEDFSRFVRLSLLEKYGREHLAEIYTRNEMDKEYRELMVEIELLKVVIEQSLKYKINQCQ